MGKPAVRITDPVQHILPPILTGGPVSPNVLIGGLPASLGGLIASFAARRQHPRLRHAVSAHPARSRRGRRWQRQGADQQPARLLPGQHHRGGAGSGQPNLDGLSPGADRHGLTIRMFGRKRDILCK